MNIFIKDKVYKSFIILFIACLLVGFNSGNNTLHITTNGNQKYLANTVILKLKQKPLSSIDGKVGIPSLLTNYLNKFDVSSSTSLFPDKKNENGFGLDRIIVIKYTSNSDPFYSASKL